MLMSNINSNLEQLLAEKNVLESKINEYKLRKQIIFETNGIEAILEQGKQLVQKGFTAQQANEVLQKICREAYEELCQIDKELQVMEEKLIALDNSIMSL